MAGIQRPGDAGPPVAAPRLGLRKPAAPRVTFVEAGSKTWLSPEVSKGCTILKAGPDAKLVQGVSIAVVAFVMIDFVVKRAYASVPIPTTATAPAVADR